MVAVRLPRPLSSLCCSRAARRFFGDDVFFTPSPSSSACLADQFSSPKTVGALSLDDAGAVADIALYHALLGLQLTGAFAFIAVRG